MNNKGFTLIELLVVISIIGILGVVITISLTHTLENTNKKNCEEFIKEVEEAACTYAGVNPNECNRNYCPAIKLETLIKSGYIKSEVNSCTGKSLDSSEALNDVVNVKWENNEKICIYEVNEDE